MMRQMNERDINECLLCVHFNDLVIHKRVATAVLYLQHDMLVSREKSNSVSDCLFTCAGDCWKQKCFTSTHLITGNTRNIARLRPKIH